MLPVNNVPSGHNIRRDEPHGHDLLPGQDEVPGHHDPRCRRRARTRRPARTSRLATTCHPATTSTSRHAVVAPPAVFALPACSPQAAQLQRRETRTRTTPLLRDDRAPTVRQDERRCRLLRDDRAPTSRRLCHVWPMVSLALVAGVVGGVGGSSVRLPPKLARRFRALYLLLFLFVGE